MCSFVRRCSSVRSATTEHLRRDSAEAIFVACSNAVSPDEIDAGDKSAVLLSQSAFATLSDSPAGAPLRSPRSRCSSSSAHLSLTSSRRLTLAYTPSNRLYLLTLHSPLQLLSSNRTFRWLPRSRNPLPPSTPRTTPTPRDKGSTSLRCPRVLVSLVLRAEGLRTAAAVTSWETRRSEKAS